MSICTHVEVTQCCQMSSFVAFNFILFHFEVRTLTEPRDGCFVSLVDWQDLVTPLLSPLGIETAAPRFSAPPNPDSYVYLASTFCNTPYL